MVYKTERRNAMTLESLLDELGADHDAVPEKELKYTVIVVDGEANEFRGVNKVYFNHDDRNVTIETY
jgi:hypothetical protein